MERERRLLHDIFSYLDYETSPLFFSFLPFPSRPSLRREEGREEERE